MHPVDGRLESNLVVRCAGNVGVGEHDKGEQRLQRSEARRVVVVTG
jgi:hypothetical protein